jgi:hypothetical protein
MSAVILDFSVCLIFFSIWENSWASGTSSTLFVTGYCGAVILSIVVSGGIVVSCVTDVSVMTASYGKGSSWIVGSCVISVSFMSASYGT